MTLAALAGQAGIDPVAFLTERSPYLRSTFIAVIERSQELAAQERQDLAVRVANSVGELFKKR